MTMLANIGLPVGKGAGFSTILSPNSGPDSAFIVVTLRNDMNLASTASYVAAYGKSCIRSSQESSFCFDRVASYRQH